MSVVVKQQVLAANPCQAVDFPVRLKGTTRKPHYMTASEQARIEFFSPSYLRNIIVIVAEMGLRPYKELLPMKKYQLDLENEVLHISDSTTTGGIADIPMTPAQKAFRSQAEEALDSEYLFPSPRPGRKPYVTTVRKAWEKTLRRAGLRYFSLYELRHTFATQCRGRRRPLCRSSPAQDDSAVFKPCSQAKLEMLRKALRRLDGQANERSLGAAQPN